MESASYMENNVNIEESQNYNSSITDNISEEYTPKLFSEEESHSEDTAKQECNDNETDQLFDQDINEDEDFEIPAFLRKQKF